VPRPDIWCYFLLMQAMIFPHSLPCRLISLLSSPPISCRRTPDCRFELQRSKQWEHISACARKQSLRSWMKLDVTALQYWCRRYRERDQPTAPPAFVVLALPEAPQQDDHDGGVQYLALLIRTLFMRGMLIRGLLRIHPSKYILLYDEPVVKR